MRIGVDLGGAKIEAAVSGLLKRADSAVGDGGGAWLWPEEDGL